MLARLTGVVALSALVAGCSDAKEIKKLASERRSDIEAALVPYREIPGVLEKTPPFTDVVRVAAPTRTITFSHPGMNAMVLHAEDLTHLGPPGPVPFRMEGNHPGADGWTFPNKLAQVAATGEWKNTHVGSDLEDFQYALEEMKQIGWVLVVREAAYTPPKSTGELTFEPAHLRGDAVLISLADRKVLGGFPFDINGRWGTLSSRNGPIRGSKIVGDVNDTSDLDVRSQLGFALGAGVEALLGRQGKPPYADSYYSPQARAEHRAR